MMVSKVGDEGYKNAVQDLDKAQHLDSTNDLIKKEYREAVAALKSLEEGSSGKKPGKSDGSTKELPSMAPVPTMSPEDEKRLTEQVPELSALNEYF